MSAPAENPRHSCLNCYRPLPAFARHCPHCGQKDSDGRITLWVWVKELMDTVFNIDSRFFRTIGGLFNPGKLTEAYFEGKHERYVRPLRLFFITAVIHFAVISTVLTSLFEGTAGIVESNRKQAHEYYFEERLNKEKDTILLQHPGNEAVSRAMDSLLLGFQPEADSIGLGYFVLNKAGKFDVLDVSFALKDMFSGKKAEELIEEAGITDGWAKLQLAQLIKFNKSGESFPAFIMGKMIWMVLLMMPALALILKLLYIRRKRYFVEHLVFSYHYHAFAFLAMSVALLIYNWGEAQSNLEDRETTLTEILIFPVILIYLFWAMRRVYKQSIFRTFLKFMFLNFAYLILFTTALSLTLLAGFLLF
ncbi:MAG: DUF3667 domain-containing protein [Saprospiraceae bacterium]|nr:DUF3667 domain-containing protein [Saprospiraceae bacterium]MDZ4704060.1 DUF3667 domain-containing protein [Saprospiraceae bacterium]